MKTKKQACKTELKRVQQYLGWTVVHLPCVLSKLAYLVINLLPVFEERSRRNSEVHKGVNKNQLRPKKEKHDSNKSRSTCRHCKTKNISKQYKLHTAWLQLEVEENTSDPSLPPKNID